MELAKAYSARFESTSSTISNAAYLAIDVLLRYRDESCDKTHVNF